MAIEIRSYWDELIHSSEKTTLKEAVEEAVLSEADLRGAVLRGADLSEADLREANLRGADLSGADLSGANLREADLRGAVLREADLSEAVLRGADLREADLREANLRGAILHGADLSGADLSGVKWPYGAVCLRPPVTLSGLQWSIIAFGSHLLIGCQCHTYERWEGFCDRSIEKMDSQNGIEFWHQWKSILLAFRDPEAERLFTAST